MFAYKIIMGESNIFTIIGGFLETLKPIFFAMFIAYILYIPAKRIELFLEKSKSKIIKNRAKAISIAVVYIITLLLIVSLIVFGGRVLAKNFEELIKMIPNYVNDAMNFFKNLPSDNILTNLHLDVQLEKLKQMDIYKQILQQISVSDIIVQAKLALNFVNGIFDVFVMIIVSIYLLYSRKEIQGFFNKTITAFFNQNVSDIVSKYIEKTNYIFFRFVTTQILDGFIVAIIVSISLSIMRVKYAVALGFLIGISNLIPFFGASWSNRNCDIVYRWIFTSIILTCSNYNITTIRCKYFKPNSFRGIIRSKQDTYNNICNSWRSIFWTNRNVLSSTCCYNYYSYNK